MKFGWTGPVLGRNQWASPAKLSWPAAASLVALACLEADHIFAGAALSEISGAAQLIILMGLAS